MEDTDLRNLAAGFASDGMKPPFEVLHCLGLLIGDAEVSHSVATYALETASDTAQQQAVWECLALAGGALVKLRATCEGRDWFLGGPNWTVKGAPTFQGELVPLTEVSGCRLVHVEGSRTDSPVTRWELRLRSAQTLPIPWSERDWTSRENHEALALAVASHLR